jgi:hypothetical protein
VVTPRTGADAAADVGVSCDAPTDVLG